VFRGQVLFEYHRVVVSPSPTFVSDETQTVPALLERARAGDAEAFGEVCRVYETRLLRQAMTLCGNLALAEDLAQDTLVEAWKGLPRYHGRCQFFTWLCAILLNRHRNSLRQKRPLSFSAFAGPEHEALADRLGQAADDAAWPDEAAHLREQAACVRKCVQTLPLKHQQVVHLRFYVDDSLEGIAAALGCSVGTVKSRLFHALEKLRAMRDIGPRPAKPKTKAESL
jgi:RNA polymerase sigma-70 factor (ECF subfamily)